MSKDELVEWIVKKQVEIKMNYPATPEILLDNQYNKGINEGLRMVWEHIVKDGE